jgi:hypothetical protein
VDKVLESVLGCAASACLWILTLPQLRASSKSPEVPSLKPPDKPFALGALP